MKGALARGRSAIVERLHRAPDRAPDRVPDRAPVPDAMAMLGALPVPLLLLDAGNRFRYANQAAEEFLGVSMLQLGQITLSALLPGDNPLFALLQQARQHGTTLTDHDLTLESPRLHKRGITVQVAPLTEEPGHILLTLQDTSAVRIFDRKMAFRGAARSVSGMSAILAHEVKNPLSGIRGAAQLLETSVSDADRELTVLIRDEADRIRELVDRMEVFDEKPIERRPVNIHRVLEHVRRLAQTGVAQQIRLTENYDPSLPPAWANRDQLVQVLLNLVKNAAESIESDDSLMQRGGGEIILTTAYQHGLRLAVPGSTQRQHLPRIEGHRRGVASGLS